MNRGYFSQLMSSNSPWANVSHYKCLTKYLIFFQPQAFCRLQRLICPKFVFGQGSSTGPRSLGEYPLPIPILLDAYGITISAPHPEFHFLKVGNRRPTRSADALKFYMLYITWINIILILFIYICSMCTYSFCVCLFVSAVYSLLLLLYTVVVFLRRMLAFLFNLCVIHFFVSINDDDDDDDDMVQGTLPNIK